MDVDGNGQSTFADRYIFNRWLELGGDVDTALSRAVVRGATIDLSEFFSSSDALLAPVGPSAWDAGGASPQGGGGDPEAPFFTRRIPPQSTDSQLTFPSQDPRVTPDGRFMVFSTAADLKGIGTPFGIRQVYRVDRAAGGAATILLVSRDNDGNPATAHCDHPSISDDGDVVVFSTAAVLSEDDSGQSPARADVYARILSVPATRLLSIARDQIGQPLEQGDGDSVEPCLSGDGSFAAFSSKATNLIPNDSNGARQDIFRVTTDGVGTPGLVSIDNSGAQGSQSLETDFSTAGATGQGAGACIDRTGTRILFHGTPCDWTDSLLCPAPGNNCGACLLGTLEAFQQVYLRDLGSGTTYRVSRAFKSATQLFVPGDADSARASISADGGRIAFGSNARNFRPDLNQDPDLFEDIFLLDFDDLVTAGVNPTRVSVPTQGSVDGASQAPMLSSSGDRIAFHSSATTLVPGDTNGKIDVFVRDITSGTNRRFSVTSGGAQATQGDSRNPDITADGRVAVYESWATNLNPGGDGNGLGDIYETLSPQGPFIRGDANDENGAVDVTDAVFVLAFLFEGGPVPPCLDAADADDTGVVNLTDANYILNFLFRQGPPPPRPYPGCGNDPSGDALTCTDQSCP